MFADALKLITICCLVFDTLGMFIEWCKEITILAIDHRVRKNPIH